MSRISRSPGQEHEDVAGALGGQLADRLDDRLGLVPDERLALLVLLGELDQRAVADVDGVGPAGDLDDRRRLAAAVREVRGEPLGVDRRGGDDHLEVRALRQQPAEVAEDEVDVERPLVRLVDDDRVVLPQLPVALQLGEQDAVGHQLQPRRLRGPVGEADLVADQLPQLGVELGGDPLGDRPRGDPAGLGVPDQALLPAPQLEADLRQLGGLPGAGLARDDDDLVVADGGGDVVTPLADRQLGRVDDREGLRGLGHNGRHCARGPKRARAGFGSRPGQLLWPVVPSSVPFGSAFGSTPVPPVPVTVTVVAVLVARGAGRELPGHAALLELLRRRGAGRSGRSARGHRSRRGRRRHRRR